MASVDGRKFRGIGPCKLRRNLTALEISSARLFRFGLKCFRSLRLLDGRFLDERFAFSEFVHRDWEYWRAVFKACSWLWLCSKNYQLAQPNCLTTSISDDDSSFYLLYRCAQHALVKLYNSIMSTVGNILDSVCTWPVSSEYGPGSRLLYVPFSYIGSTHKIFAPH
jgi:hypothetical protein